MEFPRTILQESIAIGSLISFHYFEYAQGFLFEGEAHNFWEFLYVDKGEVEVRANDRTCQLKQGQIIFHKPNEFHSVRVSERAKPPNLIVIAFDCLSPAMTHFEGKLFDLGDRECRLLSLMLESGFQAFSAPFDDPSCHNLTRRPDAPFASEQLLKSYLEILLISLVRLDEKSGSSDGSRLSSIPKENGEAWFTAQILQYMRDRLAEQLTLNDLSEAFHISKSRLKELFHAQTGAGVLETFKKLRIEQAKTIIRENRYNYTEIAEILGYRGIHYFSRDFKKMTGMSPSEYAKTVKARLHPGQG